VQAAQAGIKIRPDQYLAYTNLCRAYNDVKKPELAIIECNKALKLNPNDGETSFYLARAYDLAGKGTEATFVKGNPNSSDGYYLLGNAYFADNQRDKAVEAYNKCLQLNPTFVKARYNMGIIQVLQKNKVAAMEQYNSLRRLDEGLAGKLKVEIDKL
jgi:tetratricopeptide (TPR) repeat protein